MTMKSISAIWHRIRIACAQFFTLVFGKISWSCPQWLKLLQLKFKKLMQERPILLLRAGIGLLIVIVLIAGSAYWYKHLPPSLLAEITPPAITPNQAGAQPQPLVIKFGKQEQNSFYEQAVAPIGQVGNAVNEGISIKPEIRGGWVWQSDSHLVFNPSEDWQPNQKYSVRFAKVVFSEQIKLEDYHYEFTTSPFAVKVAGLRFYQDPTNPNIKQIVGTIESNFPLDTDHLEKYVQLNLDGQSLPLTFNFSENGREAYFHTESIVLSTTPRYAKLIVAAGINSANKTAKTAKKIEQRVLVPDSGSLLQVQAVKASIIRDSNDNPDQIIMVETSIGVSADELMKKIHVYALPKKNPDKNTDPEDEVYAWQSAGEVTPNILKQATPVKVIPLPSPQAYTTLHSFKIAVPTPSYLFIGIDKGLIGWGNYALARNYATVVKTPDYPQEVRFLHKGALLAGEQKLTVLVRGLPTVKFSVGRVLPGDINHLVTQTQGDFQNPQFLNTSFGRDNIAEVYSELRHFNIDNVAKLQYTTLDLAKYLNEDNKKSLGLFLLRAEGWDEEKEQTVGQSTDRLILITDLGFLVKNNADNTHDVFVQSINQGTPIAGAVVQVLGRNGVAIINRQTDKMGHASIPDLSDFIEDQAPVVYLIKSKGDVSFMPYERADRILNYSQFPIDGVNDTEEGAITAYLFSDRGIYRPGDEMHLGYIVKKQYALTEKPGLPLQATITDPRGQVVFDQKLSLPADGYFTFAYKPSSSAPTGNYNAELYIVKDGQKDALLGSTLVRVEEFLPDRLKAQTQILTSDTEQNNTRDYWLSPERLQAKLQVNNLFGTPAQNRLVRARIALTPQALNFKQFPGFVFVDPLLDPKAPPKTFSEDLTETHTDDKGQAKFNIDLSRLDKATYQLNFSADIFEADGGRGVGTQVSTLITPLSQLVGYKADADLNFLQLQSQHSIQFIAVNPELKTATLNNLHANFFTINAVSTLVKNPDGTYEYQTIKQEKPAKTVDFNIGQAGTNLAIPTSATGEYALTITDTNGQLLTKLYYSVVGPSQRSMVKNVELNVKLDKPMYQAGETVNLQIDAPYTGSGLITIERDKIYSYKWFKADSRSSIQSIQIPKEMKGDAYINVAFVRSWNSDEIFVSPLSYSVVPLRIDHQQSNVAISLTTPPLLKPGEALNISYSTDRPSKIIIYAVDEGILQVANYTLPDPLGYFFRKHALTVGTAQILDQILPRYLASRELSAVGGDGGEAEMLIKNLNPFKRKTQAPVVYWSGILDSDEISRTVSYTVPSYFNGSVRVMAVAVAENAVGSVQKESIVKGDFVISPNLPTFIAPGDIFSITAGIANNNKVNKSEPVVVKLTTSKGLTIKGEAEQRVDIKPGSEGVVHFDLQANNLLGNADLIFAVSQAERAVQMTESLSIRSASAFQTLLTSGATQAENKSIKLNEHWYAAHYLGQVVADTNPLILANGLQTFLSNYPYDCTEQLISKSFATLALAKQPLLVHDNAEIQRHFAEAIQLIRQRQNSNGSINYWPNGANDVNNNFATVYAVDYLLEAKQNSYAMPEDLLKAALGYLQDFIAQPATDLDTIRLQAQAIYELTRSELITSDYIANLLATLEQHPEINWQKDITSAYLASSFKLLKDDKEADRLIKLYDAKQISGSDFNNKLAADAQYLTLLARHFPNLLTNQAIMQLAQSIDNNQLNTLSAAYSVNALSAYAQSSTSAVKVFGRELLVDGIKRPLKSINTHFFQANVLPETKEVVLENPNKANLFYQVKQAGFLSDVSSSAEQHGLEISRKYLNDKKAKVNSVELGKELTVEVQLRSKTKQSVTNVAIVDLLPGGLSIIPNSVTVAGCEYYDVREDRIILYCTATDTAQKLIYRVRAVNKGKYLVPAILATAMYNPNAWGRGATDKMTVSD